ncbi:MAG: CapA family protein [Oscillospiraceae bacterium]|nr:CapA family protein [Oscillospiraceae bacterium]
MNKKTKIILLIILVLLLVMEVGFVAFVAMKDRTPAPTEPSETAAPTETKATEETEAPTEATEAPTEEPTEPPTEAPTEPEEQNSFILTFTGDCTLGTNRDSWNNQYHFIKLIGEDYDYPFANVVEYFENDDFTMINLEGVLAESGSAAGKRFTFRGPTAYTQIMTGSSVEAVTLANNHTEDFGKAGYQSTVEALQGAGITYVEKNASAIYTTEGGLTIGLYAGAFNFDMGDIKSEIKNLRSQGADIVVCAFHWGTEGAYRPNNTQQSIARQAIDAGADIIYGHHPHVLQKVEEYNGGIIYYSLGNFSFGGSVYPQDYDSAVLQQEVVRNEDGSFSLGKLTIIPVSISSISGRNNFQPTPLAETDKAYDRVLSKLDGTFTGPNLKVDYGDKETEPPTEAPTEGTQPTQPTEPSTGGNEGATQPPSGGDNSGATQPPSGGNEGATPPPSGGESGGSSSGGGSESGSGSSSGSESGSGNSGSGGSSSGSGGDNTPAEP